MIACRSQQGPTLSGFEVPGRTTQDHPGAWAQGADTHVALAFTIHKGPEHRGGGGISREAGERELEFRAEREPERAGAAVGPWSPLGVPLWRIEARSQASPWRLLSPSGQSRPLFLLRSPQVTLPEWSWGLLLGGKLNIPMEGSC